MSEPLFEVIDSAQGAKVRFEILQYKPLELPQLYLAQRGGMRFK
jgi:hypothetical protein